MHNTDYHFLLRNHSGYKEYFCIIVSYYYTIHFILNECLCSLATYSYRIHHSYTTYTQKKPSTKIMASEWCNRERYLNVVATAAIQQVLKHFLLVISFFFAHFSIVRDDSFLFWSGYCHLFYSLFQVNANCVIPFQPFVILFRGN